MDYDNMYGEQFELIKNAGKLFISSYENSIKNKLEIKENLLICGMGGSAISGNYIQSLYNLEGINNKMVITCREYDIPRIVNKHFQVIIASYSGNTEETVFMVEQVMKLGIRPSLISSGGKLKAIAEKNKFKIINIKRNLQPRAAFPLLFGSLYGLVSPSLGFMPISDEFIKQIIENSKSIDKNLLEDISNNISLNFPIIISSNVLIAVATRFRCQLNENSKISAASFTVPEFSHNAIVGFDGYKSSSQILILLRSSYEHYRVKLQLDLIREQMKTKAVNVIEIRPTLNTHLGELLSLTWQLDYISVVLAKKQNINLIDVPSINSLKNELRKINY